MENFKGCQNTKWNIKTRFFQEVKVEPSILVDVTGWTFEEIQEFYNNVNKQIMIPKEKAVELYNKFDSMDFHDLSDHEQSAKDCAIIVVDEILDVLGGAGVYSFADQKVTTYWEGVKAEIEGLVV